MNSDLPKTNQDIAEQKPEPPLKSEPRGAWGEPQEPPTPLGIAWFGVVLAAACYPIVVAGFMLVHALLTNGLLRLPAEVIGMGAMFLVFGCMIALTYGAIMAVPAFFLTRVLSYGLKGMISERGASGIFGGLTGFLCASGGGFFWMDRMSNFRSWEDWSFFAIFPLTASVMGYAGAIWAGYLKRNDGFPFFEPIFVVKKQITIRYLMKLTFAVAVLAVVFKAAGASGGIIGITWMAYLLVQVLLLACDHLMTCWLKHRSSSSKLPLSP